MALGLATVFGFATRVSAQDALSNLGQALYGGNFAAGGNIGGLKFGDAVEFTTGPASVYFTGATFPFFKDSSYAPATGVEVSLNSGFGSSGSTGLIALLNGPSAPAIGGTPATFSYTAAAPILLAPDTRYWLQVDAFTTSANTYILWSATTSVGGIDAGGLAGWSYFDPGTFDVTYYFTNSGGTSWTANTNPTASAMFSVQYAPIPEPDIAVAAAGLVAFGVIMRRRGRQHGH